MLYRGIILCINNYVKKFFIILEKSYSVITSDDSQYQV